LNVVLCWHMHQPDYRLDGSWQRPWTWLHAIKDYTDMAAHLERVPGARAVVNFSPVLLLQLQDLAARLAALLVQGTPVGDPVLDALGGITPADGAGLTRALLRVHEETMAGRFAPYRRLADRAALALAAGSALPAAERDDLLVWYTLCWLGESVRGDRRAVRLQGRAGGFTATDRRELLQLLAEQIGALLPRYRALADAGRIELSVSPFSHPILPLLLDFAAAAEALPTAPLPAEGYPGGAARCDWQLSQAVRVFRDVFGHDPAGCWPSEGGLSEAVVAALGRHGFAWTASGTRVLGNSLGNSLAEELDWPQLRAWRLAGASGPACFFRDDELSDRIGFVYSAWPAAEAVADCVASLERIGGQAPRDEAAVLAIIMDGENAWEYYRENGWAFLQGLYRALAAHPGLRLTTFAEVLQHLRVQPLPRLVAGSWVHGTFSTWIGAPARNRAWSLLVHAKQAVDAALAGARAAAPAGGGERPEWTARVFRQLAVCEASDWFWWLDEANPHPDVDAFDALFRRQLAALYRVIGSAAPAILDEPVVQRRPGGDAAAGTAAAGEGAMRHSGEERSS
jgi:alpha-amylase/alpha-mannosidase (GH57 family)